MKLIEIDGRTVYGFAFASVSAATAFAERCHKPQRVVLGDHPAVWVVSPADAERLARAGYEYAV